jgi:hypothetical protein
MGGETEKLSIDWRMLSPLWGVLDNSLIILLRRYLAKLLGLRDTHKEDADELVNVIVQRSAMGVPRGHPLHLVKLLFESIR